MISKIFAEEETENKKPNTDPLMEKFLKTRQIIVSGEVNAELVERIVKQLLILEAESDKPIYLYIDSPGGSVDDGFGLYDVIRSIKAPVYTIGMGLIASMGVTLFLSVPKERRFSLPNSHFLIHQPLGGSKGVATDIEITVTAEDGTTKEVQVAKNAPLQKVEIHRKKINSLFKFCHFAFHSNIHYSFNSLMKICCF